MQSRASQLFESMTASSGFYSDQPVATTAFSEGRGKGSRDYDAMMDAIEQLADAVTRDDRKEATRWKEEARRLARKVLGKDEADSLVEKACSGQRPERAARAPKDPIREVRRSVGSANVSFGKEVLAKVPVYQGDRPADIKMRALDHIRKNTPSKILKALSRVTIEHKGKVLEAVDLTATEELILTKAYTAKNGRVSGQLVSGTGKRGGRVRTGVRQFDAMKSLIDKGLLEQTGYTNEQETKRGFKVNYLMLQGEITDAGKAYFETDANETLETVSEARVGRFYPTAPNLTRRQFIEKMLGLLQELNVTATQTNVDREAVTAVMAKADQALMDWMLKEHKGMLARMHDADQVAYRAELRDIESRLKRLRAARDVSWDTMSEIIQSAIELYGF